MATAFPHHYSVSLDAVSPMETRVEAPGRPSIAVSPPPELDGLPDTWSPEHLLLAASASCFAATFQTFARASKFEPVKFHVAASGTLDKTAEGLRFTAIALEVRLRLHDPADEPKAQRLLEKAKRACIVANALRVDVTLTSNLAFDDAARTPAV